MNAWLKEHSAVLAVSTETDIQFRSRNLLVLTGVVNVIASLGSAYNVAYKSCYVANRALVNSQGTEGSVDD